MNDQHSHPNQSSLLPLAQWEKQLDDLAIRATSTPVEELVRLITHAVDDDPSVSTDNPSWALCSALFEVIEQRTEDMEMDKLTAMCRQLASRREEIWQRVCVSWVLSCIPMVRHAVLPALSKQAQDGTISPQVINRLSLVLDWMPDEKSYELLRELLEHGGAGTSPSRDESNPEPRNESRNESSPEAAAQAQTTVNENIVIDGTYITLPDEGGVQALAILAHRHNEADYILGLVGLAHSCGLRYAQVFTGLNQQQQHELFNRLQIDTPHGNLSLELATRLINASIADQLDSGSPPPPEMLDLITDFGLEKHITAQPLAFRQWLEEILDPDNTLDSLTAQKRGRLINRSADWGEAFPIVDSWLEDTPIARDIYAMNSDLETFQRQLRRHLDVDRRPWWAEQCFRAALALKQDQNKETWMSFAAVGKALLDGRELRKIPLFDNVLNSTMRAHEEDLIAASTPYHIPQRSPSGELDPSSSTPPEPLEISAELRDTLERYYSQQHAKYIWTTGFYGLHGYLFAIATHPELIYPSEWIWTLAYASEQGNSPYLSIVNDQEQFSALMQALVELYNVINSQILEGLIELPQGCELRSEPLDNFSPDAPISQWAQGFRAARQDFGHLLDWLTETPEDVFINSQEKEIWEEEVTSLCGLATMALEMFADRDKAEQISHEASKNGESTTLEDLAQFAHATFHECLRDISILAASARRDMEPDDAGEAPIEELAGRGPGSGDPWPPLYADWPPAAPHSRQPRRSDKIGRNEPCPCGSGSKYKRCCGDPRKKD